MLNKKVNHYNCHHAKIIIMANRSHASSPPTPAVLGNAPGGVGVGDKGQALRPSQDLGENTLSHSALSDRRETGKEVSP